MRLRRTFTAAAALVLASSLAACGDAGNDDDEGIDVDVRKDAASQFDEGTRMRELADDGKIRIGVKFDQPGIGFKGATDDKPSGFDPEIGKVLAADLGIDPDDIEWVETISANREAFLEKGQVDLVIASYSITDERREVVGQAGPYYVTGQQLLVRSDSDIDTIDDVKGTEVCSVTGSTSLDNIEAKGATPRGFDTYSECVDQVLNGTVDAMTTDGAILLGYAAQHPDDLKVVVDPFSEERYGVGYSKDSPEMCEWIVDTLSAAQKDGDWAKAFEVTLGKSGVETPEPPKADACA
ncbi:glutamate ABC transporter substrate-binding protein [Nocardioides sp. zg-536]|uniref:Glutamate ABC transporter substrate-binding protein n=1 Tax=Nocardioides faecalis TaxID=2803858 RepID=A0A938YCF2_9ACTN|nr:glutamate ABC transporter substrate-binding protein [Nocardioides faecalis]MBM9461451.1 glutamate ABC transporter substrate-binding protein [Nocardioides faecalis]MBS4751779.1 glutamate ABC transporter substrate-binding protein [Nocardioides faecalis]QVI59361.1 glutamate ABC transporter substrate-binding protein [Nocardioides faecalis]